VILKVLDTGPALQWSCPPEIRTRLLQEGPAKHPHGIEALQNSLRYLLLETLHRLGHHEPLRPHVSALMQLMLKIMAEDNEEHAILALKIIIDLHRNYKETVDNAAQDFLDLVKQVYLNMNEVIQKTFGDESGNGAMNENGEDDSDAGSDSSPKDAAAGTPGAQTPGSSTTAQPLSAGPVSAKSLSSQMGNQADPMAIRKLPLGMKSLKLLAECPIAVVFLFQTYRDIMPKELPIFVPLIFQFLELQAAPQAKAHHDAAMRGETFIGITPVLHNKRAQFTDLIISEVKVSPRLFG
jgi:transformation/transcription domain-associated protein